MLFRVATANRPRAGPLERTKRPAEYRSEYHGLLDRGRSCTEHRSYMSSTELPCGHTVERGGSPSDTEHTARRVSAELFIGVARK